MRLACTVLFLAACGGAVQEMPKAPTRAVTPGDALFAHLPAGAHAVLEVDLMRLRRNPTVGPLAQAVASDALGAAFFGVADAVVIGTYGLGERARHVLLARGGAAKEIPQAVHVADDVYVIASPDDAAEVMNLGAGAKTMADDVRFLTVRAQAMPEKADGAVVRATAVLDFAARVDVSRRLDLEAVPTSFSVWGDVVDDMAVVALLGGQDEKEARELAKSLDVARARLVKASMAMGLLFRGLVKTAKVQVKGQIAQVVLIVGPKRLERLVSLLMRQLGAPS